MYRKYLLFSAFVFSFLLGHSQESQNDPFSFKWDNGFKLENRSGDFRLKFGGRIMVDHAYFFQNNALNQNHGILISKSGTELRRARLFFSGKIYENTLFKIQVEFSGNKTSLKDVYVGINNIPAIGTLLIGHFKEPIRLATLTSSKFTTFMEPAQNDAFAQSRNNGLLVMNDFLNKRLSAQVGVFRNADNNSNDAFADDGYIVTGRVTGLVLRNETQRQLLHLGAAYSFRKPESKEYQIAATPGAHLSPEYIDTGIIKNIENIGLANFETLFIQGPFAFQVEYLNASVKTQTESLKFSNYYGEISYFLTGESKNYKSSYEGLDRVKPKRNFMGKDNGPGALELAFRFSETDLSYSSVVGGKQSDFALGLNWYLNPATRLMVNYIYASIRNKGDANIIQGRLQIDF